MLERALRDLNALIPERRASYPVVADVGCGWGRSLKKLHDRFAPQSISYPYLWWSREDLGLVERLLRGRPSSEREETRINLVAVKPII